VDYAVRAQLRHRTHPLPNLIREPGRKEGTRTLHIQSVARP
jgi:hypothetical protein